MIFNGHQFAKKLLSSLKGKISLLPRPPRLLIVVAKEDIKGQLYTRLIQQQAQKVGIKIDIQHFWLKNRFLCFDKVIQLHNFVKRLHRPRIIRQPENFDPGSFHQYSGILIQKPGREVRQKYFKTEKEFEVWWLTNTSQIPEKKDVDCLNVANLGLLTAGLIQFYPAAVKAIWRILNYSFHYRLIRQLADDSGSERLIGKRVVILGSSEIVGKPLSMLLRNHGVDVIMVAEGSQEHLKQYTKASDMIISCVGKPKFITAGMVKKGSIVIDAGYTFCNDKPTGDIDFDAVKKKAAFITPVPGGVGPATIACLLENVYLAAKRQEKIH